MKLRCRRNVGDDLRVVDRHVSIATKYVTEYKLESGLVTGLGLLNLLLHDRFHILCRDRVVTRLLQRCLPVQDRGLRRYLCIHIR